MQIIDFGSFLSDGRLISRGKSLVRRLFSNFSCSIQSLASNRAEQKGYYRFINSPRLKEEEIIGSLSATCNKNCNGKIVLAISDTTDINLTSHKNRLKSNGGYGILDSNRPGYGFKLHPTVVVDADTLMPLGISSVQFLLRTQNNDKPYSVTRMQPVMEKESAKWPVGVQQTRQALDEAKAIIFIQDREGDIYEQWAGAPTDGKSFLLIRSKADRRTAENDFLSQRLNSSPVLGTYTTILEGGGNRKEARQEATFEVRVVEVSFKKPDKKSKGLPSQTPGLYVIETKQINPPEGKEPVVWRLVTTWPLTDFESICTVIGWYEARWYIEEVFRVLKKEVVDIESCELEDAYAIRKFILILLEVIIKIFQVKIAYEEPEQGYEPQLVFTEQEQRCLVMIYEQKLKGKTEKQNNPHQPDTLAYMVWIIARLGGWKGYISQQKPGATTLAEGLKKFYQLYAGFQLFLIVGTR